MTGHYLLDVAGNNKIVLTLLGTAVAATMPPPGSPFNWKTIYTWFFDAIRLFTNLRHPSAPAEPPSNPKP